MMMMMMSGMHPRHRVKNEIHCTTEKRKEGRIRRARKSNYKKKEPKMVIMVVLACAFLLLFLVRILQSWRVSTRMKSKENLIEGTGTSTGGDVVEVVSKNGGSKKISQLRVRQPKWENKMDSLHNDIPPYESDVDPVTSKLEDSEWPHPIIHVVNTRFMQNQANLPILAQTRFQLFEAICYSTMIHSDVMSNKSLLWIIKVDPNLNQDIVDKLVVLLKPHDNFFLVSSLENFGIGHAPGAWRGGVEPQEVLSHAPNGIHTGDIALLKAAERLENDRIILETRLDADDGLSTEYLSMVQKEALDVFMSQQDKKTWGKSIMTDDSQTYSEDNNHNNNNHNNNHNHNNNNNDDESVPRWFYWCVRNHAEWYADIRVFKDNVDDLNVHKFGHLDIVMKKKMCVTPGLTVGFNKGTKYEDVPQYGHNVLYKKISAEGNCYGATGTIDENEGKNNKCIKLLVSEDDPVLAIRSRTPTSAGMMNVFEEFSEPKKKLSIENQKRLWLHLQSSHFMINANKMESIQGLISENLSAIAKENLKGQCTEGHSCKFSSKEMLQRIIETEEEKHDGTNRSDSFGLSFNMGSRAKQQF